MAIVAAAGLLQYIKDKINRRDVRMSSLGQNKHSAVKGIFTTSHWLTIALY